MRQFIPFEVDNVQYQMLHLPVSKSVKVLTRLTKIVSDPLGKALSAIKSEDPEKSIIDQELDMDLLGNAITALADRLDEGMVWNTILELLSTVEKINDHGGYTKINPEIDFQGQPGHLMKVVGKSITINYSDFLDSVLGGLDAIKLVTRPKAEPSTGSSGDL